MYGKGIVATTWIDQQLGREHSSQSVKQLPTGINPEATISSNNQLGDKQSSHSMKQLWTQHRGTVATTLSNYMYQLK